MIRNRSDHAAPPGWRTAAVLILVLALTGCGRNRTPVEPDSGYGTEEEYAVYRTLFADSNFYRSPSIVLLDSTQAWDFLNGEAPWKGRMSRLSDETLENYLSVNRTRVPMKCVECPGKTCALISFEEMAVWKRFFPDADGAVTVSRVGFDRPANQALVYWSVYFAPLAAFGSVVLLEKEGGLWIVRQSLTIWVS